MGLRRRGHASLQLPGPAVRCVDVRVEFLLPHARDAHRHGRAGDSDKPIWATEFGAPTGTDTDAVGPTEQADILRDGITEQRALGFVDKLFVYSLLDRGTDVSDREQNFGVLAHDGTAKPAWDVLRTAAVTSGCL